MRAPRGGRWPAAALRCGCTAPARGRRLGWAKKLHGEARKVLGYSIWAMGERTDGATASRGSPAFMEAGGGTPVWLGGGRGRGGPVKAGEAR